MLFTDFISVSQKKGDSENAFLYLVKTRARNVLMNHDEYGGTFIINSEYSAEDLNDFDVTNLTEQDLDNFLIDTMTTDDLISIINNFRSV